MSNLPQIAHPLNCGSAENPYIPRKNSIGIEVPFDLGHKRIIERSRTPAELDEPGVEPSIRKVWMVLDSTCKTFNEPGIFMSAKSIGGAILRVDGKTGKLKPTSARTVEAALKHLEDKGYIDRRSTPGRSVRMIWCLWRTQLRVEGLNVNICGTMFPMDELSPVPRSIRKTPLSLPPESAKIPVEAAINCALPLVKAPETAQKTAEDSGIELRKISNSNSESDSFALLEGGEAQETPSDQLISSPSEVKPDPAPSTPATPLPSRDICRMMLRRSLNPEWAAFFVWAVIDQGWEEDLPKRFQGANRPNRPAVEVAIPAAPTPSSRPVAAAITLGNVYDQPTDKLIYALAEVANDQVELVIGIIAVNLVDEFRGSHRTFVNRLRELRAKQISTSNFLKAYRAGQAAKPDAKVGEDYKALRFNRTIKPFRPR